MTLEEKYTQIIRICSSVEYTREQATEAIKQYAREMCDRQKNICETEWVKCPKDRNEELRAITNAPYPKELQ